MNRADLSGTVVFPGSQDMKELAAFWGEPRRTVWMMFSPPGRPSVKAAQPSVFPEWGGSMVRAVGCSRGTWEKANTELAVIGTQVAQPELPDTCT
ncbi:hypothetical protein NKH18_35355 [Streptomyces sp. M10(2022)]